VDGETRSWGSRHPALLGLLSFVAGIFIGPIVLVTLIGAALVSPSSSRPATLAHTVEARPTPVQTVTATPTGPVTAFGPGMYHVGVGIEPGTYTQRRRQAVLLGAAEGAGRDVRRDHRNNLGEGRRW
jgi:hypothetical protein